jgi:hypothetical protein
MTDPPTSHDNSRGKAGDKVDHPIQPQLPWGLTTKLPASAVYDQLRMASATTPDKPPEGKTIGVGGAYVVIVILIIAVVTFAALWR